MRVQDRQRLPQNAKEGNRSRLPSLMISLLVASVSPHPHSGCRLTISLGRDPATGISSDSSQVEALWLPVANHVNRGYSRTPRSESS